LGQRRSSPLTAARRTRASRTSATSPRCIGAVGSASRADASSRLRALPRMSSNRTARGRRFGLLSTRAVRSPSLQGSGRAGGRFARSRKAGRQTTSSRS
jgi:hypothetical protein